jgi:hypothetical protein
VAPIMVIGKQCGGSPQSHCADHIDTAHFIGEVKRIWPGAVVS